MTIDASVVTAFVTALSLLATAVGTLILQARKVDPENVKTLNTRAKNAEARADVAETSLDVARSKLMLESAEVFRLSQILTRHGVSYAAVPETGAAN